MSDGWTGDSAFGAPGVQVSKVWPEVKTKSRGRRGELLGGRGEDLKIPEVKGKK